MRSDPLGLRRVSGFLAPVVPEWLVACAASLSLTVSMSLILFAVISYAIRKPTEHWLPVYRNFTGCAQQPVDDDGDAPVLQPLWNRLLTTEPFASYVTTAAFPGVLSAIFYWMSCMPFALLDLLAPQNMMKQYKFQPDAPQGPSTWTRALWLTAWHHLVFILPGLANMLLSGGPWLYLSEEVCMEQCDGRRLLPTRAPRVDHTLAHLALATLLFDMAYFCWHALHHLSPVLYKHIHSVHHEYRAPNVFVTQHEHALELLVVSVWSVLIPIALGHHPLTMWLFMMFTIQLSTEAHSGWALGIGGLLERCVPFFGGAMHHDNHHQFPRRNFEPFFTFLDRAFGTMHVQEDLPSRKPALDAALDTVTAISAPACDAAGRAETRRCIRGGGGSRRTSRSPAHTRSERAPVPTKPRKKSARNSPASQRSRTSRQPNATPA